MAEGGDVQYVVLAVDGSGNPLATQPGGTVEVSVTDVTTDGNTDYTNPDGTDVVSPIVATIGTAFTIDAVDDVLAENVETFNLSLVDDSWSQNDTYEAVTYQGTVETTITDDSDNAFTLQLFAVTQGEGGPVYSQANSMAEGGDVDYVVMAVDAQGVPLATQPSGTVTVNVGAQGDSALPVDDYTSNATVLATIGTAFSISAVDDVLAENTETFNLSLAQDSWSNDSTYENVVYQGTVETTITDEDVAPTIETSSINVSEEGLLDGIPDASGTIDTTDLAVHSGTIAITGNGTALLTAELSLIGLPTTITSGGELITWDYDGSNHAVILGEAGGDTIIQITLNDGSTAVNVAGVVPDSSLDYEVALLGPVDHQGIDVEDTLSFNVGVTLSDGVNPVDSGTIGITIEDDMPTANGAEDSTTFNHGDYAFIVTENLNVEFGADGFGNYAFTGFTDGDSGEVTANGSTSTMTVGGIPVLLSGAGTNILTGTADGDTVFTVTLNDAGTYTLDMVKTLDSPATFNVDDLGGLGISGGNITDYVVGSGTDTYSDDILITAVQPGGTVNTANDDIGTGSQWIVPATGLKFEFVEDIQSDSHNSGPRTLTGVQLGLADVKGGDTQTNVLISLYDDTDNIIETLSEFNSVVTAISYMSGGILVTFDSPSEIAQAISNESIKFITDYEVIGKDSSVDVSGIVVYNVDENTDVGITTNTGFDSAEFVNHDGSDFSVNGISGAFITNEPVSFDAMFTATDGDGDTVKDTFTMNLNPVIDGSDQADTLTGGDANELLRGFGGDDIIDGGAGADTIDAGDGDDTIVFDAADSHVDGEGGFDTLLVAETTGALDFSNVDNVEKIDMNNDGTDQVITLSLDQVLSMTDENNVLHITGENDGVNVDSVNLTGVDTGGWTNDGGGLFTNVADDTIHVTIAPLDDGVDITVDVDDGSSFVV